MVALHMQCKVTSQWDGGNGGDGDGEETDVGLGHGGR